jgi:excisionase family DNA binding protein
VYADGTYPHPLRKDEKLKQLITANEIARMLNVTKARVYDLARQGIIPSIDMGRNIRFDTEQIESWIRNGGKSLP